MVIKHIPGDADRMQRVVDELSRKAVRVGYFPHSRYPDGKPVAGVAVVQEYGSVKLRIPPRPTFGPAVANGRQMQRDAIAAATRRAIKGTQTVEQGLDQLGMAVVGDIKQAITELTSPELAESTIEARRRRNAAGNASTKPLVDTGFMLQEVTHVVGDK